MILLVDVSLSPLWIPYLQASGIDAVYWGSVGRLDAPDIEIMRFAAQHGHVLLTHDLDFGAMIAAMESPGPSVIQVRAQDVLPDAIGQQVVASIRSFQVEIASGALVTITKERGRARLLPFRRSLRSD